MHIFGYGNLHAIIFYLLLDINSDLNQNYFKLINNNNNNNNLIFFTPQAK